MHSRLFLVLVALLISASNALAQSNPSAAPFTLQVAAFPNTDLADRFVVQLVKAGEHPSCATVELEGRGYWTRVFVGLFSTADAARRYGEGLVGRGIIREFLVKRADFNGGVTRPRRVTSNDAQAVAHSGKPVIVPPGEDQSQRAREHRLVSQPANVPRTSSVTSKGPSETVRSVGQTADEFTNRTLPLIKVAALKLAPNVDTTLLPRPDPVELAFRLVVGESDACREDKERGGLWVTGDADEALARLRWIVGDENADLIEVNRDGRVRLNKRLLASVAGLDSPRIDDPVEVAYYISSNEGLLLLVQLTEGRYRYCLHIGEQAATYGRNVEIAGSINLDNNFDSRINPYRKNGKKLDRERPPEGFDSLVALNPVAQWFNLGMRSIVPPGEITFHELAEAHAKIEIGLDYLESSAGPGAHALALERERRLKSQRPDSNIVVTAGSNRVLRSKEEIRLFFADGPAGSNQR